MTVVFWVIAVFLTNSVFYGIRIDLLAREVALAALGLLVYSATILSCGQRDRLLQSVSAILGVGALISVYFIASAVVVAIVANGTGIPVLLVFFIMWSISAKGHIIGKATDRGWYFGAGIAGFVFALQWLVSDLFPIQS